MDLLLVKDLKALSKTMNFENALYKVVNRLVRRNGPGLLVLYGPDGANKTTFLQFMKNFENGPSIPAGLVPDHILQVLSELKRTSYRCVSIGTKGKSKDLFSSGLLPLDIILPLTVADRLVEEGLNKGHHILVLCDDMENLFRHGGEGKERDKQYLLDLAKVLDGENAMTFLGTASTDKSHIWNPNVLGPHRVLPLGWD